MAVTITVVSHTGTLKKINEQYIKMRDDFSESWKNTNASNVSDNDTLSSGDVLLIEGGNSVTLKFQPDTLESNGQGGMNLAFLKSMTFRVTEVSGTVYLIRAKDIGYTDSLSTIYSNANRVAAAANDSVGPGDLVLTDNDSGSYFKFLLENGQGVGTRVPVDGMFAMPDLLEGVNAIQAF